jgi:hypothetical protein
MKNTKAEAPQGFSSPSALEAKASRSNLLAEANAGPKSKVAGSGAQLAPKDENEFRAKLEEKLDNKLEGKLKDKLKDKIQNKFESKTQNKIDEASVSAENQSEDVEADVAEIQPVAPQKAMNLNSQKMITVKAARSEANADINPEGMSSRVAWNSFLHKMKEKLGVSTSDILHAFKSLSEDELKQPPEQNINKLVAQLGLNDQQAVMAHQFFKDLIVKTDAKALADGPAAPVLTGVDRGVQKFATSDQFFVKPPVVNQEFSAQASHGAGLGTSQAQVPQPDITKVNEAWQIRSETLAPSPTISTPNLFENAPTAAFANSGTFEVPEELVSEDSSEELMPTKLNESLKKSAPTEIAKANPNQTMTKVNSFVQTQKLPKEAAQDAVFEDPAPVSPQPRMESDSIGFSSKQMAFATLPNSEKLTSSSAPTPMFANDMPFISPPALGHNASFGTSDRQLSDPEEDSRADGMLSADDAAPATAAFAIPNAQQPDAGVAKASPQAPLAPMPVHELVSQAQVMVKEGGGEMNVVLKPEGLGEVAMKVSVLDGKVHVQMITQTDDAKKLLENSFHGLRESLGAHHLSLETIKVDSAASANLGKQLDQQSREGQRQAAQQFMEQFRDDNSGSRRSLFDIPGAGVYRSQGQKRPENSLVAAAVARPIHNRRLDLVA